MKTLYFAVGIMYSKQIQRFAKIEVVVYVAEIGAM